MINEAGDVLWYLMLLLVTQKEEFTDFIFPSEPRNVSTIQIMRWIDKLSKYATQHDFDNISKRWKPRENCQPIRIYLTEICEYLLLASGLTWDELIKSNVEKLTKRLL